MCRVLDVSRAGFYRYLQRPKSARAIQRLQVKKTVEDTFKTYKARYGAPRIAKELNDMGIPCSKNHVALLLQESGLKARNGKNFKYRPATEAMTNVSENLLCRNFDAKRPNQKCVTDITYIWVKDKWLYLAVVMDLCSRAVVGWALDTQMTDSLVIKAFEMATSKRKVPKNMIVHSDRGVQYRSTVYQKKLKHLGCRISMSRKGNCWDNAAMEAFFSRLKVELIYAENFETVKDARSGIFEYIEVFYNRLRRHSAIGYISPIQFEKLCA